MTHSLLDNQIEPITASDDEIRSAVDGADLASFLPALLPALSHALDDESLLIDSLRPDGELIRDETAGLTPDQQMAIRRLAVEVLIDVRDARRTFADSTVTGFADDQRIQRLMSHAIGQAIDGDYVPLMREELSVTDDDLRAPQWRADELAPDRAFPVAIIGAGMSGILAAHRLQHAGVPFVVYEKNDDVGGTWLENTYPGCRVDVSNHVYSYSFAQRNDWPYYFSPQPELLDYFRTCADEFGIREHIRFGHEVTAMAWSDDEQQWTVDVDGPDGTTVATYSAVISAVGQLNRPNMPNIDGMNDFGGPSFHSAQWNHDVDLTNKHVVVIGAGASAVQFAPHVAEQAAHLSVLQRTPNWFVPVPNYHHPVADGLQWLFRHVPGYAQWYRFWMFWRSTEGLLPACAVDEDWGDMSLTTGEKNAELRELLEQWLYLCYADRPDLHDTVRPMYPPASKRIVLDNGSWSTTMKRDDVTLDGSPIARIEADAVVTVDGDGVESRHRADVIIYATGFQASKFLTPMKVVGTGGRDLHEVWDGDARAYLGVVHPGFPNFFLCYGPNTNIVVNGSIIYFSECEVRYAVATIEMLLLNGWSSADCRQEVHDEYNQRIDDGNLKMAWGVSTVNSWYKADSGRVAQNWPFSLLEYWQQTRSADPADYHVRYGPGL
ncbi:MAG: flavin-containing monooxygenase [Ilumatobacter sp.]